MNIQKLNKVTKVNKVLDQVGLRQLSHKNYLKKMSKMGNPAEAFMDAVDNGVDPADMAHIYDLQHADWKVSKLVSSFSYYPYYSEFLVWVLEKLKVPARYLDLGCGNGLFSLALSSLWEKSLGVGIDKNEAGVSAALKLSGTYQSKGAVDFLCADLCTAFSEEVKSRIGKPDVIFSVFLFHELLHDKKQAAEVIRNLARIIEGPARLISLERFPETELQRDELISLMGQAGIAVEAREILHVGDERFPLTMFGLQRTYRSGDAT